MLPPNRKVSVVWDLRYHYRAFLQSSLCAAPIASIVAAILAAPLIRILAVTATGRALAALGDFYVSYELNANTDTPTP